MMRKNKKLLIILLLFCVGMFAFAFALVPLYNVMCKVFNINGKMSLNPATQSSVVDTHRLVTIQFLATVNDKLPWKVYPEQQQIAVHPGQNTTVYFVAENKANQTITAHAVPSIAPAEASNYFKKIECFCFREQTLKAHEQKRMPVIFYIDTTLPKKIHEIALSYVVYAN